MLGGPTEVRFESFESKTASGEVVFNEIQLEQKHDIDLWIMRQSHHGIESKDWDLIQIRVDKSKRPYQVSYHQLDEAGNEIDYRASCLRCHSGGPRAIRPNWNSQALELSFRDKVKIAQWNFLIKSYGDVELRENNSITRVTPLHSLSQQERTELKVKACTQCHFSGGPRSPLTKEQTVTMKHLVDQKAMPPWPHKLSPSERKELNEFIYGL